MKERTQKAPNGRKQARSARRGSRNKETAFITYFFVAIFLAMSIYFVWFLMFSGKEFIKSPYNTLQDLFAERVIRGDIETADGKTIATSRVDEDGNETRSYPYENLFAHVAGYSVKGKSGIENQENFELLSSHEFFLTQIINDIRGQKSQGDTVVTTLDFGLQDAAYHALGNYDGAVVAMEPSTGKVLCMVSKPDFNPNTVETNWEKINEEGSSVLVNRTTQGKYAPGSVFKIFTTLEYYREHPDDYGDYRFDCDGAYTSDSYTIHCASNKKHGSEDLESSFANSCNASYANLALTLDLAKYHSLCESLLFDQSLPIDLESSKSSFTLEKGAQTSQIMATGIGQGDTLVSPLHMLLVVSAVEEDGVLMRPYLVDQIRTPGGTVRRQTRPSEYDRLLSSDEASLLSGYLRSVVTDGTGAGLNNKAYDAYGKTGTAQVSDSTDETNAWFVGYAKKDARAIAVAVIVEDSGAGSTYAVPIAQKIFEKYFSGSESAD